MRKNVRSNEGYYEMNRRSFRQNGDYMNREKSIENKMQDKSAFKKFIIIMVVCFFGGGIVGFCSAMLEDNVNLSSIGGRILELLYFIAPFGNLIAGTVFWILIGVLVSQGRKLYQGWDGEEEAVFNKFETKLSYALVFTNLNMLISYFFMGAGFYSIMNDSKLEVSFWFRLAALLLGMIYSTVISVLFQKKIINLEKEINPEKQGSVYDVKFKKIWLESCDEAEKFQIYKASYKSYQITGGAYIVVWLFCFVGMTVWDFGILPMTIVLILWAVSSISYSMEAIRLSKNPSEIMK